MSQSNRECRPLIYNNENQKEIVFSFFMGRLGVGDGLGRWVRW